jgi:hypothetical protein
VSMLDTNHCHTDRGGVGFFFLIVQPKNTARIISYVPMEAVHFGGAADKDTLKSASYSTSTAPE